MKRWLTITLSLLLTLSILSSIAVWIGYQQPLPDHIAMLHFDMCEPPCWIGITPGVTRWTEAKTSIVQIFSSQQGFEVNFSSRRWQGLGSEGVEQSAIIQIQLEKLDFSVSFYYPKDNTGDRPIILIDFSFYDARSNRPTLADSHIILGQPQSTGFIVSPGIYHVVLHSDKLIRSTAIIRQRFRLNDGIQRIYFVSDPVYDYASADITDTWHGFAALNKYIP